MLSEKVRNPKKSCIALINKIKFKKGGKKHLSDILEQVL